MVKNFTTTAADKGKRLDQFLQENCADISRTKLRKIIDLGGVHVGGRRQRKCGATLGGGTAVELHIDNGPLEPFRITEQDVLFQDDHLIVLNKPAGVETQPTPARYKGTLYEALQIWLGRDTRFGRKLQIGMVQRLDRETSGVIVFSIHPVSHKGLSDQFQQRTIAKYYLAAVAGVPSPEEGEIISSLSKDRRTGLMHSVAKGGKQAITRYKVLKTHGNEASLVEIDLKTGRTHQIRTHMAEAGHPLLGDTRYGGPTSIAGHPCKRHYLHSQTLDLLHPVTHARLCCTAPLPADMASLFS